MRKILMIALTLAAWFLIPNSAQAQQRHNVPATPYPIEVVQPNGDTLTIRLHGDERRSWRTTEDGYLICKNKRGVYCYAKYTNDGTLKATCRTAHNKDQRKKCEARFLEKHITNTLKNK